MLVFQFHKGTIKTERDRLRVIPEEDFNSIKVRLKQRADSNFRPVKLFQFHKGTIKTLAFRLYPLQRYISIP